MLTEIKAGRLTLRGVSLGGVYTSIHIPEFRVVLDVGMPIRSFSGVDNIFVSHGHGDHAGSLGSLVGIRSLLHRKAPPNVYSHEAIADRLGEALQSLAKLQRHSLDANIVPMAAGDEVSLRKDLLVRAFRTHHTVPSLGFQFFDRVQKLRPEFRDLPGEEIRKRRERGDDLHSEEERLLFAYATDTLLRVIDTNPSMLKSQVLMLECTFLDEKKTLKDSRAGCHIHLDELLEVADRFENEHLVLMHFSQLYSPDEVREILKRRLPKSLLERTIPFVPKHNRWPG